MTGHKKTQKAQNESHVMGAINFVAFVFFVAIEIIAAHEELQRLYYSASTPMRSMVGASVVSSLVTRGLQKTD